MVVKKNIINTDEIGKKIGLALYRESSKKNITQTKLAKNMGIRQSAISGYFTGKVTTSNIEQYWKIAEAIPISRSDFDKIVENAKTEVLGIKQDSHTQDPDEQIKFALNSKGFTQEQIDEMLAFIAFKESQK